MDTKIAFGNVLRRVRQEAGLAQERLSFDANLDRSYVSRLELGQQQPSLATIFKLANALNIPAARFVELVEHEISAAATAAQLR